MTRILVAVACLGLIVIGLTFRHWPVRCPGCGRPFDTVDDREQHMRTAHRA